MSVKKPACRKPRGYSHLSGMEITSALLTCLPVLIAARCVRSRRWLGWIAGQPFLHIVMEKLLAPTAIGKKNWLFVGEAAAGQRSAIIYTLIESCRRRGLDPYQYLREVLHPPAEHDQSPNPRGYAPQPGIKPRGKSTRSYHKRQSIDL